MQVVPQPLSNIIEPPNCCSTRAIAKFRPPAPYEALPTVGFHPIPLSAMCTSITPDGKEAQVTMILICRIHICKGAFLILIESFWILPRRLGPFCCVNSLRDAPEIAWYDGRDRMSGESGVSGLVEADESTLFVDTGFHRADSGNLRRISLWVLMYCRGSVHNRPF